MPGSSSTIFRPDFLVIGAQKAGTTWLHESLRGVPGLWLPADKDFELLSYRHHLDSPDYRAAWDRRFAGAGDRPGPDDRVGDSCASYLWAASPFPKGFNRDIPATATDVFGDQLKVIALLREPGERAVSGYLHHLAHGSLDWNRPMGQAPDELGIVALGRYGAQLTAWQQALSPQQVLVLPAPGEAEPGRVLAAAGQFLGVDVTAHQVSGEPVHSGLVRRRDGAGGVWVRPDDPALAGQPPLIRPVALETEAGQAWVRLVHPAEINRVRQRLTADREQLSGLLGQLLDAPGSDLWAAVDWVRGISPG